MIREYGVGRGYEMVRRAERYLSLGSRQGRRARMKKQGWRDGTYRKRLTRGGKSTQPPARDIAADLELDGDMELSTPTPRGLPLRQTGRRCRRWAEHNEVCE
jgi:hypothetical protein